MTIRDFVFACSIDESPAYFTYDNTDNMMIIQSKVSALSNTNDFHHIEPYVEALISHESIHLVINKLEDTMVSEKLDDIEILVYRDNKAYQVTVNNMLFADDMSGLVLN